MGVWTKNKLVDVAEIIMGQSPDGSCYNTENNGMPFLQGCAEFGKINPVTTVFSSQIKKIGNQKSILFSVRAPVGKLNIADRDYCIGRGLSAIVGNNVYQDYLFQYLQFLKNGKGFTSQGSTFDSINFDELSKIEIEAPKEKSEQTCIAEILSTADESIALTEAIIAKYQRIKTGLMQDLLTRGIDENGNIRSRATHKFVIKDGIKVPEEWEVRELNSVSSITRLAGYEYSTVWKAEENGDIIALRGFNIGNNKIIEKEFERISFQLSKQLNRSKLNFGDVVFPCVGTIGNAVVIRENDKYHINQNIAKITPKKFMSSDYIAYYLMSEQCKKEIDRFNATSSQPNVLVGSLRKFIIPYPKEINEQINIVKMIETINFSIDNETLQLSKLQSLKTGLMQDLLSGKVRVKMDIKN